MGCGRSDRDDRTTNLKIQSLPLINAKSPSLMFWKVPNQESYHLFNVLEGSILVYIFVDVLEGLLFIIQVCAG